MERSNIKKIPKSEWHPSQRGYFSGSLYNAMADDDSIFCITADLGYGMFDKIRDDYPDRFINVGAAEQAAMGIAVGLALEGKIPFVYSITPFLIYRPFETIKLYLDGENIPVKLVGSGLGTDYKHDGPSHDATGVEDLLTLWPNIKTFYPQTKDEVSDMVKEMIKNKKPCFIGLRR